MIATHIVTIGENKCKRHVAVNEVYTNSKIFQDWKLINSKQHDIFIPGHLNLQGKTCHSSSEICYPSIKVKWKGQIQTSRKHKQ